MGLLILSAQNIFFCPSKNNSREDTMECSLSKCSQELGYLFKNSCI